MKSRRSAAQRKPGQRTPAPGLAHSDAAPQVVDPAQSLDLLRHPELSRAARETAIVELGSVVGNVQVARALAPQIQRDDERPTADPAKTEQERRDKQAADSQKPVGDRLVDVSKELVLHYAAEHLRSLGDEALRQLRQAWRESPGGVITAGAILGSAGAAYLVGTRGSLPAIPIPLDFLADRVPAFRGAEITLELQGPVTAPEGARFGLTLREPTPRQQSRRGRGGGTIFTPRMTLRAGDAVAEGPEVGNEVTIQGRVPVPHGATAADVSATIAAIEDGSLDIGVGGSPALRASVLSATDSFTPDRYGLRAPPIDRHLLVRIRTAVPPMFHQGPDIIDARSVSVRINGVSNEGDAQIRVHLRPFPSR